MLTKHINRILIVNLILLLLFITDRITKHFFAKNSEKEIFLFFKENFKLWFNFSKNYDIAFGIKIHQGLLYSLIIIALAFLLILLIKNYFRFNILQTFFISLIIIGAISNLIDRLTFGYVIDFINLSIKNWPWPVFNLSDCFITLGVGGWLITNL